MRILFVSAFVGSWAQWLNKNIVREVSVRENGIIESTTVYTVERTGTDEVYKVSVPHASKVGSLRFSASGKDFVIGKDVKIESTDSKSDIAVYALSGVDGSFQVKAFQGDMLSPYPTKIMELESQQVLFTTGLTLPSMYPIESQTTTVTLPSSAGEIVSSYPSENSRKLSNKKMEFGPFNGKISNKELLKIHFG